MDTTVPLAKNKIFLNIVIYSYLDHKYMEHGKGTDDWSLELGYQTAKKDTFPRRAMSAGSSAGLFLELKAYGPDLDYICKGPVQGFKV